MTMTLWGCQPSTSHMHTHTLLYHCLGLFLKWFHLILISVRLRTLSSFPAPLFRTQIAVLSKSAASLPSCHGAKPHPWSHTILPLTNVSSWNPGPKGQQLCCKGPLEAFGYAPVGFQSTGCAFITWLGVLIKHYNAPWSFWIPSLFSLCNSESLERQRF